MSSSEQPNLTIRPQIVPASLTYASLVFAGGFVCGMIRVPILLPLIGVRYAELVEMPIMAFILWRAAGFVVRRYGRKTSSSSGHRMSGSGDTGPNWLLVGFLGVIWMLVVELLLSAAMGGVTGVKKFITERDVIAGPASSHVYRIGPIYISM